MKKRRTNEGHATYYSLLKALARNEALVLNYQLIEGATRVQQWLVYYNDWSLSLVCYAIALLAFGDDDDS